MRSISLTRHDSIHDPKEWNKRLLMTCTRRDGLDLRLKESITPRTDGKAEQIAIYFHVAVE